MKTMPCEHRQMTLLAALTVCVFYVPAFPASAAPISSEPGARAIDCGLAPIKSGD